MNKEIGKKIKLLDKDKKQEIVDYASPILKDAFTLINGECLTRMADIEDHSVDLICVDLPYGVTKNKWDSVIPLDLMWKEFNRLITPNGAIVLTATQPFSSILAMSNLADFKYDLIWEKTISSGQLNVSHQPMRNHESILVFYKKKPIYNEQKTVGEPYSINRKAEYGDNNYSSQKSSSKSNDGYRHAKSVLKFSNPRIKGGHPTQKPVELMEYIIKTYSNVGSNVLDCCMGAGTTGVACGNLKRKFIGIEMDKKYFFMSVQRIEDAYNKNDKQEKADPATNRS